MATVLIVGEEPSVARIIRFKLEQEGHRTRWVEQLGGEDVPDADVVVLDAPPGGAAASLVARLASRAAVLVLTDLQDPDGGPAALGHGAAAFLPKPFRPTQLARLVRQLAWGDDGAASSCTRIVIARPDGGSAGRHPPRTLGLRQMQ